MDSKKLLNDRWGISGVTSYCLANSFRLKATKSLCNYMRGRDLERDRLSLLAQSYHFNSVTLQKELKIVVCCIVVIRTYILKWSNTIMGH